MKTMVLGILILYSANLLGAPNLRGASKTKLYTIVSGFEILSDGEGETIKFDLQNVNGDRINDFPTSKMEEYQNFERYSFHNPFVKANAESLHIFDLYIFKDIKPSFVDNRDSISVEESAKDLRFTIFMLMERATQKTIRSKVHVHIKEKLLAAGDIESNAILKLSSPKTSHLDKVKITNLKIIESMMDSHKRTFDLVLQGIQSNRPVEQIMRLSLSDISKVPIVIPDKIELEVQEDNEESVVE